MEISVEPWKKLIIHEVIEYKFDDWVKQIAFSTRSSGGGIPTVQWTNGIVFAPANFPTTKTTVEEWNKIPEYRTSLEKSLGKNAVDKLEKDVLEHINGFNIAAKLLYRNWKSTVLND